MLSVERCKQILNSGLKKFSNDEIKEIRICPAALVSVEASSLLVSLPSIGQHRTMELAFPSLRVSRWRHRAFCPDASANGHQSAENCAGGGSTRARICARVRQFLFFAFTPSPVCPKLLSEREKRVKAFVL